MNAGDTTFFYIEDAQDCNFDLTIKCHGFGTAVKVTKSSNLTFKDVTHYRPTQRTFLNSSIRRILYSL